MYVQSNRILKIEWVMVNVSLILMAIVLLDTKWLKNVPVEPQYAYIDVNFIV